MANENPYQSPQSDVSATAEPGGIDEKTFKHLALGQKMAIYAIVLYYGALLASNFVGVFAVVLIIIALVLALVGLVRILMGAEIGVISKVLLFIAMFIPLINLIALARINRIATKALESAGYKVGFMGVKGGYAG